MKITDIVNPADIPNLNEMFDKIVPPGPWRTEGAKRICELNINGEEYQIQLQFVYVHNLTCVNASFLCKDEEGKWVTQLTSKHSSPSTIMGSVSDAIFKELSKYDVDAVSFIAVDNIDKRLRIYNWIVDKHLKDFGNVFYDVPVGKGRGTILVQRHVNKQHVDEFIQSLYDKQE